MRKPIIDQFTDLKVSRQRKWQLRKEALGLCPLCGEPKGEGLRWCFHHAVKVREDRRTANGSKKRYYGAKSYQI